MKQNVKPFLIAAIAVFGIGAGFLYASNRKNVSSVAKIERPTNFADNYVPSSHRGVVVRQVPQENPQAKSGEDASIYIKPGGQRPARVTTFKPNNAPTMRRGQSAKGGTAATLPANRLPLATARKDKNGHVSVD